MLITASQQTRFPGAPQRDSETARQRDSETARQRHNSAPHHQVQKAVMGKDAGYAQTLLTPRAYAAVRGVPGKHIIP